jgi:membrane protease YdiL (CAAX protease family)
MNAAVSSPVAFETRALTTTQPNRQKYLYVLQIAVALLLFEGVVWSSDFAQGLWLSAAALWILVTTLSSTYDRVDLGLRWQAMRRLWWLPSVSLVLAVMAIALAWRGGALHPAFGTDTRLWQYGGYFVWALFQQFVLQSYFFVRLEFLLRDSGRAVLACALLFSLLHIPNAFLMVTTLAAGLVFCELFRRHRSLYPLGLAHAICGLCIAVTLSTDLHHGMRVGQGFLDYYSSPTVSSLRLSR